MRIGFKVEVLEAFWGNPCHFHSPGPKISYNVQKQKQKQWKYIYNIIRHPVSA
jgi:hypothetical protein